MTPKASPDVRRAVWWLFVELLDEWVPAGELERVVRSVRQTVLEEAGGYEMGPGPSPMMLGMVEHLTAELCEGAGMYLEEKEGKC